VRHCDVIAPTARTPRARSEGLVGSPQRGTPVSETERQHEEEIEHGHEPAQNDHREGVLDLVNDVSPYWSVVRWARRVLTTPGGPVGFRLPSPPTLEITAANEGEAAAGYARAGGLLTSSRTNQR